MPALRALRRGFPDHELVLAAPRVLEPLVRLADVADRLLDTRGLQAPAWTGGPPEVAVNLHGRGPRSHERLHALRPGLLVAFGSEEAGHPGPVWDAEEHETRRWCRLLTESLGIDADPRDLALPAPSAQAHLSGAVVVHPGAAHASRRWPPARFAAVARGLTDAGCTVVVTGGPDEVALATLVARQAGLPSGAVLAGRTDLEQLAAQVAGASLVVCGDTGTAHLATAFGTPSVLLFGPVPPSRWGPPPGGPHTVLWPGTAADIGPDTGPNTGRDTGRDTWLDTGLGDPWGDVVDPALSRIGVAEVVDSSLRMLRRPLSRPASASRTTSGSG